MRLRQAKNPSRKESRTRAVRAGSVTVRIYENLNRGKTSCVVYWRVGKKPERMMFFDLTAAKTFAKDTAETKFSGSVEKTFNSGSLSLRKPHKYRVQVASGRCRGEVTLVGWKLRLEIVVMFLRKNRKRFDGKIHEYWTVCETVRTQRGSKPTCWSAF